MTKEYHGFNIHITDKRVNGYFYAYWFVGDCRYNQSSKIKMQLIMICKRRIDDIIDAVNRVT